MTTVLKSADYAKNYADMVANDDTIKTMAADIVGQVLAKDLPFPDMMTCYHGYHSIAAHYGNELKAESIGAPYHAVAMKVKEVLSILDPEHPWIANIPADALAG